MNIKAGLGILVTLILFYLLFRDIDLLLLFEYFKQGNIFYILLGIPVYLFSFIFRGLRWQLLLGNLRKISLGETIRLTMAGYAVNNVLPSRIGEFTRAYLAGVRNNVSRTSALATIFVERIFDGLTITAILSLLLFLYQFPGWVKSLSELAGMIFISLFILILLSSFSSIPIKVVTKLKSISPDFIRPVLSLAEKFLIGVSSLADFGQLLKVLLLSFLIWGIEIMVYVLLIKAFGVHVPLVAYFLMLVTVNMGMLIPSTPAGLGIFQYAIVKSLEIFSVVTTMGMAIALVLHMVQIVPVTIIGLSWIYFNHISIAKIEKEKKKTEVQKI